MDDKMLAKITRALEIAESDYEDASDAAYFTADYKDIDKIAAKARIASLAKSGFKIVPIDEADASGDDGWLDISSLPEGRHVILYFERGERGDGGIETATVFFNDGDEWSYWTHGGPNSGSNFEPGARGERPTKWRDLPWPSS